MTKTLIICLSLLAACTSPMRILSTDAGDAGKCRLRIENAHYLGGCRDCDVLNPVSDVDVLAVWLDGIQMWPWAWEVDDENCLVLRDCDEEPHVVMVETACLPPRTP